jgi:hypothetical protein
MQNSWMKRESLNWNLKRDDYCEIWSSEYKMLRNKNTAQMTLNVKGACNSMRQHQTQQRHGWLQRQTRHGLTAAVLFQHLQTGPGNLTSSQWWYWRQKSSGMLRCANWKTLTDVSIDRRAFIFRVWLSKPSQPFLDCLTGKEKRHCASLKRRKLQSKPVKTS